MLKKAVSLFLVLTLILSLAACTPKEQTPQTSSGSTETEEQKPAEEQKPTEQKPSYKIGIITGTVSQGEEEYRAAEKMKAKYGDMIITQTYPDKFMTEQETTIANSLSLAADPDV